MFQSYQNIIPFCTFLVGFFSRVFIPLSDAYQYKCRVALWKHPRLRKYYFYRSRGYTVSQIMDHRANSNQPQIVKIRKGLVTSIELILFDPVHFRIEHLNRKKVEKVSISKAVAKNDILCLWKIWYHYSMYLL